MFAMDHSTVSPPRKSTAAPDRRMPSTRGLTPGTYRKPHRMDAMTPGTPYGRKKAARKKPHASGPRRCPAAARAPADNATITGTWTTPNSSTRPKLRTNGVLGQRVRRSCPARRRPLARRRAPAAPVCSTSMTGSGRRRSRSAGRRSGGTAGGTARGRRRAARSRRDGALGCASRVALWSPEGGGGGRFAPSGAGHRPCRQPSDPSPSGPSTVSLLRLLHRGDEACPCRPVAAWKPSLRCW